MAGNANSGRNVYFSMNERELKEAIESYKEKVRSGEIPRASWPHFCSTLDCTEREVADVMSKADDIQSGYKERAKALKKMATWVRGQMMSAPGWNGQMTARAIFALKQDVGDGVQWSDKDDKATGPVSIKVSFGGDDKRAGKACK